MPNRKNFVSSGEFIKHCKPEFIKQVLPKFERPTAPHFERFTKTSVMSAVASYSIFDNWEPLVDS